MIYTIESKHKVMKRDVSFTTISGKIFTYDKQLDLYVSLDGLYLDRIPDNATICNGVNTINSMEEFNTKINKNSVYGKMLSQNNDSNGAKTCL